MMWLSFTLWLCNIIYLSGFKWRYLKKVVCSSEYANLSAHSEQVWYNPRLRSLTHLSRRYQPKISPGTLWTHLYMVDLYGGCISWKVMWLEEWKLMNGTGYGSQNPALWHEVSWFCTCCDYRDMGDKGLLFCVFYLTSKFYLSDQQVIRIGKCCSWLFCAFFTLTNLMIGDVFSSNTFTWCLCDATTFISHHCFVYFVLSGIQLCCVCFLSYPTIWNPMH